MSCLRNAVAFGPGAAPALGHGRLAALLVLLAAGGASRAVSGQPILKPLDNDYVRVTRNAAPCASSSPSLCGARVLVALGPVEIVEDFHTRRMQRGEIAVFRWFESYTPPVTGEFVEVSLKQDHPPVDAPAIRIPPEKNALLFDGETFFVFEERLDPGDTRARHSHSQRVVVVLNDTKLQQWTDGQPEAFRTEVADDVRFNTAVTHSVKTIGDQPLRNVVIELKP